MSSSEEEVFQSSDSWKRGAWSDGQMEACAHAPSRALACAGKRRWEEGCTVSRRVCVVWFADPTLSLLRVDGGEHSEGADGDQSELCTVEEKGGVLGAACSLALWVHDAQKGRGGEGRGEGAHHIIDGGGEGGRGGRPDVL